MNFEDFMSNNDEECENLMEEVDGEPMTWEKLNAINEDEETENNQSPGLREKKAGKKEGGGFKL
jgi:hypothetical protein